MPTFDEDVIVNGTVVAQRSGDGAVLLTLASERGWVFRQHGTGATTALELTARSATNNNKNFLISTDGNVGIGTTDPQHRLHVHGSAIHVSNDGDGASLLVLDSERGWVFRQRGTGAATALELTGYSASNNNKNFLINTDGNVGIGTLAPEQKLHVEGSIRVTDDVILDGADCAEEFDVEPGDGLEPGTVMVIGAGQRLRPSTEPYDRRVAGVISGAGDRRPGIVLGRRARSRRPRSGPPRPDRDRPLQRRRRQFAHRDRRPADDLRSVGSRHAGHRAGTRLRCRHRQGPRSAALGRGHDPRARHASLRRRK